MVEIGKGGNLKESFSLSLMVFAGLAVAIVLLCEAVCVLLLGMTKTKRKTVCNVLKSHRTALFKND